MQTDLTPVILPKWIRANLYAQISGMTEPALQLKRSKGVWADGIHYTKGPDGKYYYNWRAIDAWIEGHG